MYNEASLYRKNTVIGEIYRHVMLNETVPGLDKRPGLIEMSWWQFIQCRNRGYPEGLWNCTELTRTYIHLNHTFHFHPG